MTMGMLDTEPDAVVSFEILVLFFSFEFRFRYVKARIVSFLSMYKFYTRTNESKNFTIRFTGCRFRNNYVFLVSRDVVSIYLIVDGMLRVTCAFIRPRFKGFLYFMSRANSGFRSASWLLLVSYNIYGRHVGLNDYHFVLLFPSVVVSASRFRVRVFSFVITWNFGFHRFTM